MPSIPSPPTTRSAAVSLLREPPAGLGAVLLVALATLLCWQAGLVGPAVAVPVLAVGTAVAIILAARSQSPTLPPDFAHFIESLTDAYLVVGPDGCIVAANQGASRLFGYAHGEMHGLRVEQLVPERLREAHARHRKSFAGSKPSGAEDRAIEVRARHQSGNELPVEVRLRPFFWRGALHVSAHVRDLRDRKEAERLRQQLSAVLENTSDFVGMCDAEGRVFYLNAAGRTMLGVEGPVEGTVARDTHSPGTAAQIDEAFAVARREGYWSGESELMHRDGHAIPMWQTITAHRDARGNVEFFSTIARNMSPIKDREYRLQRLNRTYAVLSRCNHILIGASDEDALLTGFCKALVETGGYRLAWYGRAEHDVARRVVPVTHAGLDDGYLAGVRITWADDERGRGPSGSAIRTGRVHVARDVETDPAYTPWSAEARDRGFRSSIALPVRDETGIAGALNIYSENVDAFDADELRLLEELADDLGFGLKTLHARRARAEAESMLWLRNHVIEATLNGVMITDACAPGNPLVYVNPAFEHITGYKSEEVLGKNPKLLVRDDLGQPGLEEIYSILRHGKAGGAILRNYRKDGAMFWNDLHIVPVRNDQGQVTHHAGIINDISERKRYEHQLEYQANHDELTGLPSRSLMHDRLAQLIAAGARHNRSLAVLFLDVDQFKFVNDSLGHRFGDELLKIIAARLQGLLREGDTLARYGGDEFVLLLPDLEQPEDVCPVAARILKAVGKPMHIHDRGIQTTISIGASIFPRDGTDAEALLKNADAAMYRAKDMGRNNLQFYTAELNQRAMERVTLETDLRRAIDQDELTLHYQPQVDLRTGTVLGIEALVRWRHPSLGLVPPDKFIPLAEESGLIVPMGEWVLRHACAQSKAWQLAGLPPLLLAVNMSARQLAQPNLHERIAEILSETGLEPDDLELELTESAIMSDPALMLSKLQQLKDIGVQLSIDDFGTGYSSLSHLSTFPFDKLKIDRSFIRNVIESPHDAEIALAIIALAHSLKMRVIAEGVETEGQLTYLKRHQCDAVQGYYFSPPLAADQLEALLRSARRLPLTEAENPPLPTVLLVDDEPLVLEALTRALRRESYRILTAGSAHEGFEILAREHVDAVLSDQRMPEMTGVEFLSRVKEIYPGTVRIVLSAHVDLVTVTEAFNRGQIYRYMQKPWDNTELRRELRDALASRYPGLVSAVP